MKVWGSALFGSPISFAGKLRLPPMRATQKAGIMIAICKLHLQGFDASTRLTRRDDLTMVSQWKQHLKNYFVAVFIMGSDLFKTIA
jgi:hypothetical protein